MEDCEQVERGHGVSRIRTDYKLEQGRDVALSFGQSKAMGITNMEVVDRPSPFSRVFLEKTNVPEATIAC